MILAGDVLVALGVFLLLSLASAWARRRDGADTERSWTRRVPPVAVAILILIGITGPAAAQRSFKVNEKRVTARVAAQATTNLVAAVAGKTVEIISGSICVDANGVVTGVTLQDTGGTNMIGPGIVWVLGAGQCLDFDPARQPNTVQTGSGRGLDLVTTVGNGPVEVVLKVVQQ